MAKQVDLHNHTHTGALMEKEWWWWVGMSGCCGVDGVKHSRVSGVVG